MIRILFAIFVCLFLPAGSFYISAAEIFSSASVDTVNYRVNPNYDLQTGLYDIYQTRSARIVMLGNSITHGVNWNELMGRTDIVERGIPSDVVSGYLGRMSYVYNLNPKYIFIMGGINDIYSGIPVDSVFTSYKRLIESIRSKGIIPVIQSTLYVSTKWHSAGERNPEVLKLNYLLLEYARKNKILFIDLNKKMSQNMLLRNELTYDGVHLNANGYKIWREALTSAFQTLGIQNQ